MKKNREKQVPRKFCCQNLFILCLFFFFKRVGERDGKRRRQIVKEAIHMDRITNFDFLYLNLEIVLRLYYVSILLQSIFVDKWIFELFFYFFSHFPSVFSFFSCFPLFPSFLHIHPQSFSIYICLFSISTVNIDSGSFSASTWVLRNHSFCLFFNSVLSFVSILNYVIQIFPFTKNSVSVSVWITSIFMGKENLYHYQIPSFEPKSIRSRWKKWKTMITIAFQIIYRSLRFGSVRFFIPHFSLFPKWEDFSWFALT